MVNSLEGFGASRVLRRFTIVSLICVVATALLIGLLYRQAAVTSIKILGERGNLILIQTAFDLVKPELVAYLNAAEKAAMSRGEFPRLSERLDQAIQDIMNNSSVVRIKIYNKQGIVVFSTKTSQIGINQNDNPAFIAALDGRNASKLIYRDMFNFLEEESEEDNLIQSYLPVRASPTEPIKGVFEIYENVSDMVFDMERTQVLIILGVGIILSVLFAVLLLTVRRASAIIDTQQRMIREKSDTLELLSARLLTAQEDERTHLADYLHEDLAQTLSALKLHLEHVCNPDRDPDSEESEKSRERTLRIIREAIGEVRTKAMELRPSSLEDIGLMPTITWFVREIQSLYPNLRVETQINLKESEVPKPLKIVIYRIIQESLNGIGRKAQADTVRVYLRKLEDSITLAIDDNGVAYHPVSEADAPGGEPDARDPSQALERTLLSGGTYSVDSNQQGGTVTRAVWPVSEPTD